MLKDELKNYILIIIANKNKIFRLSQWEIKKIYLVLEI